MKNLPTYFTKKSNDTWTALLHISAIMHNKSQDSKNSQNYSKSRNRHNPQRNKKKMICGLDIEVTTNISHTNPLKWKKGWPTPAEASEVERRKNWPFFGKIRSYNQRKGERFEKVAIKIMEKARPIIITEKMTIP